MLNLLKLDDGFNVTTAEVFWDPSLNLNACVKGGFWFTKLLLPPAPLDMEAGKINKNVDVDFDPVTMFIELI